jgi:regulator of protease activity HflC (stomatin/prohibitin superfamily)
MLIFRFPKIRQLERGLLFRNREFRGVLRPGRHLIFDPLWQTRIQVVSVRDPWLSHPELDVIARSGALGDEARVLDLEQHQRALVWIDGRFAAVCPAGLTVIWTVFHKVRVEIVDVRSVRFEHTELRFVRASPTAAAQLEQVTVEALGIRDVILPGEMKDLMNRVTEAQKAAEASLITRREETAAMRSQANTARILESNPTLMRLRELEVLEKVADKADLTVVLGEDGLTDRVVKLL